MCYKDRYHHDGDYIRFFPSAAEKMRIHSNGVTAFNNGIALGVGTANTASNVLDDYEEGTWTPAMDGMTQSNESGHYTKVGNVCTATVSYTNSRAHETGRKRV